MNCYGKHRIDRKINNALLFRKESLNNNFKVNYSFYNSLYDLTVKHLILGDNGNSGIMKIKNCPAIVYGKGILEKLSNESIVSDSRCSLNDTFYSQLSDSLMGKKHILKDRDILIIHLKQTAELLRQSKIIKDINGFIKPESENITSGKLFRGMIESFWNTVTWNSIFPSSPELADLIHRSRHVITDMLKKVVFETKTESFSADFFELTGISERDNNFSLSFFEFYTMSWLHNFGIIELDNPLEPEVFSIDEYGISVINSILCS